VNVRLDVVPDIGVDESQSHFTLDTIAPREDVNHLIYASVILL
jgi:hypothetical protein